jgi:hypothetical protein
MQAERSEGYGWRYENRATPDTQSHLLRSKRTCHAILAHPVLMPA